MVEVSDKLKDSKMTKTVIDIYYNKTEIGMYIEDTLYVEDGKQYMKSILVELDPQELQDNYYHIIHMTSNIARFNQRPVKIYNEFATSIVEQTTEDDFDFYGDHRTLEDYTNTHYNQHHQSIIDHLEEVDKLTDEILNGYYDET